MTRNIAVVRWNDPCFQTKVTDLDGVDFVEQVNAGWVAFIGDTVAIVNAITAGEEFEVTLIHKRLVTDITFYEEQKK